jgi:hypothetical protein
VVAHFQDMGSCTARKLQRILAIALLSQHAKTNMAYFVLSLRGIFLLKCRLVEVCPKVPKIDLLTRIGAGIPEM